MPDDQTRPNQRDGERPFRADLVAYLDSLPIHQLGELLAELPSRRQEPLQLGVLMVALNEGLPDPTSCCRPPTSLARTRAGTARAGRPRAGEEREVAADAR